jgi:hypothetical protein
LTNLLHGFLHFLFELGEPVLNVTFSLDTVIQSNVFFVTSKDLMNLNDQFAVLVVESDSVNSVEKLFEITLNGVGV